MCDMPRSPSLRLGGMGWGENLGGGGTEQIKIGNQMVEPVQLLHSILGHLPGSLFLLEILRRLSELYEHYEYRGTYF